MTVHLTPGVRQWRCRHDFPAAFTGGRPDDQCPHVALQLDSSTLRLQGVHCTSCADRRWCGAEKVHGACLRRGFVSAVTYIRLWASRVAITSAQGYFLSLALIRHARGCPLHFAWSFALDCCSSPPRARYHTQVSHVRPFRSGARTLRRACPSSCGAVARFWAARRCAARRVQKRGLSSACCKPSASSV
jgi:hypothetical protein